MVEAIVWLSKSAPSDIKIIVKEHNLCFGVRSRKFYDFLNKLPNVKLADPDSSSIEWVKKSFIVSTITGTVGYEGVFNNKSVISFGKHQLINHLDSVYYVSNFQETQHALRTINDKKTTKKKC